jgi:predicted alpha-1,2-mannosidase
MPFPISRRDFTLLGLLSAVPLPRALAAASNEKHASDWINPLIGASTSTKLGEGKTFPGPTTPFGLIQLGPDTVTGGDNASGYSWEHKTIEGFSFNRMSGVGWFGDFGNLQIMPTTGPLRIVSGREGRADSGWRSGYDHTTEVALCGYYAVTLADYNIRAEMSAAQRAGILRFTFPASDSARIQVDLARRIGGTSTQQYVRVIDSQTLEGWMDCPSTGGGWGNGEGLVSYRAYFRLEFSRPMKSFGVWSIRIPNGFLTTTQGLLVDKFQSDEFYRLAEKAEILHECREKQGDHLGFYANFTTEQAEPILVKAALSFVDQDGARKNLASDMPGWDLDATRKNAQQEWDKQLNKITVEGATDTQRAIFNTALYRAMIDPREIADSDGRYRAADNTIRQQSSFRYRTIFSGWDVFRGEFPLMTILAPDLISDEVNSLLELAELSGRGYLERWEIMNAYSGCMDGDPAIAVILDAYRKGIRSFDLQKAYAACRQTAAGTGTRTARPDNEFYMQHGYVPDQVSWTLDNTYFDWCVGELAEDAAQTADAETFKERAQNYRKIYDPSVRSMRARHRDGSWMDWKGATKFGQGCTESNPLQQSWFVPHDVYGLIDLKGKDNLVNELETFFEKTPPSFGWNPYYNHSNEPVHHIPYLFVYAGKPWLTQKWVRRIVEQAYHNRVDGICGNDDVGQMSAWYVLSALGFYPVCPGSSVYILGSPLFAKATIQLDPKWHKGRSFTVRAPCNSPTNCYVQSLSLNGKPLHRCWIRHEEITAGGVLEMKMGPQPNLALGADSSALPPATTRR